ncbi:MAG: hypothetical protein HS101_09590 [Planctomycetia bacterium]|jgi:hypothetical protein|nr:hypothetical protein [Planctomycetia bacterium]MCC7316817.1 hypothetical protein [Planctomycetota bacterium]
MVLVAMVDQSTFTGSPWQMIAGRTAKCPNWLKVTSGTGENEQDSERLTSISTAEA